MKMDFKIIHLFNDEKFIDATIKLFEEVYPKKSLYYVIQSTKEPFFYVKSEEAKPFIIETEGDENKLNAILHENKVEVVFLHALDLKKQRIVNVLGKEVLKVWFIWGFDLYWNWKLLKQNMFENETQFFMYGVNNKTSFKNRLIFNNFSLSLYTKYRDGKIQLPEILIQKLEKYFSTDFYNTVQKIDIVVPIVPSEFDYVKRINPKLVSAPFQYGNLETLAIDINLFDVKDANNILIGNSASSTNNHVDAFKQILEFKQKDQKIIVPLSYGGKQDYIKFIMEKGNDYFGNDFVPILNFMPLIDYKRLISSCGYAVFNHKRQEALGNINTMCYFGAKIFLSNQNPIYTYFKKMGVHVFNIKHINSKSFCTKLSEKELELNRSILYKIYSKQAVKDKALKLLEIVDFKLKENKWH